MAIIFMSLSVLFIEIRVGRWLCVLILSRTAYVIGLILLLNERRNIFSHVYVVWRKGIRIILNKIKEILILELICLRLQDIVLVMLVHVLKYPISSRFMFIISKKIAFFHGFCEALLLVYISFDIISNSFRKYLFWI